MMRLANSLGLLILAFFLSACGQTQNDPAFGMTTLGSEGHYGNAMWSQDGENLIIVHTLSDGYPRIEVLSSTGAYVREVEKSVRAVSPGWLNEEAVFLQRASNGAGGALMVSRNGENELLREIPGAFSASWARQVGRVVLKRDIRGTLGLWVWDADSNELKQFWSKGITQQVKLSPSGNLVAFTNESSSTVSLYELATDTVRELWSVPSPGQALAGLVFSPDDAYLGVTRAGRDASVNGFYVIPISGQADPMKLVDEDLVDPDWHPVGDRIVYTTVGVPGRNELRILTLPNNWKDRLGGG